MILALDVGNSQIFGGLFIDKDIRFQFRKTSVDGASSDEIGVFLRAVLRENNFDPTQIRGIAACSVVPHINHTLKNAIRKYFQTPLFFLEPGVKTGLKVRYHNPVEVGADRIANSIGALDLFPNKNLLIVDLGTATTFCAVSKTSDYLGGVIVAGLRISMEALESRTAKLPSVEIKSMPQALGRATVESIQSGLYFGHLGEMKEICRRLSQEVFPDDPPLIVGTGGFSSLFEREDFFDHIEPDLVLQGLRIAFLKNQELKK